MWHKTAAAEIDEKIQTFRMNVGKTILHRALCF